MVYPPMPPSHKIIYELDSQGYQVFNLVKLVGIPGRDLYFNHNWELIRPYRNEKEARKALKHLMRNGK
jgi:hypothetical protein